MTGIYIYIYIYIDNTKFSLAIMTNEKIGSKFAKYYCIKMLQSQQNFWSVVHRNHLLSLTLKKVETKSFLYNLEVSCATSFGKFRVW